MALITTGKKVNNTLNKLTYQASKILYPEKRQKNPKKN